MVESLEMNLPEQNTKEKYSAQARIKIKLESKNNLLHAYVSCRHDYKAFVICTFSVQHYA